ncbi:gas vesicle structural protein GvpA [Dactylosporangium fulvum]|uniref:Gas vesicle protein A n=1 Tax=Dactylosporangium fulvum TaxID=53359 RepID=A0ABY5VQC6_9ACTN|nr:gas vesicle protein GvpJ [Dactylosporangium fulvum]UWP79279.1 gas vesicle protein [Dactylosporangium fulvum]
MSVVAAGGGGAQSSSLADVIDTILDKGIVIDAHVSVALVGIEILTVNARVVVASVDTYLRFAQAANRLDLREHEGKGLPEVVQGTKGAVAGATGERAIEGAREKLMEKAGDVIGEIISPREREREREPQSRRKD